MIGAAGGKEIVLRLQTGAFDPFRNRLPGLLGDLELNGPLGLLLQDDGPSRDALAVRHVPDP